MTYRVTQSDLTRAIADLNERTNSPALPADRDSDGKYRANVGNFHLSGAYGGYALHRMANEGGGVTDVFRSGHIPARDLYNRINAMLDGLALAETL
jgi:hypothetical protein